MIVKRIVYPDDYVSIKRDPSGDEIELIKRYGKRYKYASLPGDIQPGTPGQCFDWSMYQAMDLGKYHYVEGLAKLPADKGWTLHAWLSDGKHAFDPTWVGRLGGGKYIGIEIPLPVLLPFIRQTEYQGMIVNRWRAPELWEAFEKTLRPRK